MMYPPLFEIASNDAGVIAVLGSNPVRVFPFGQAPQNVLDPYCVWQLITGSPYNTLSCVPGMDIFSVQVDVYGSTASQVRQAAESLRDAFEPVAHITSFRGESRDAETKRYRYSFDVDFHVPR